MLGKIKKDFDELPTWARVLFTVGIICSIIKWFPIVELLEIFLYVVVIPLGFLTMVGLLAEETSNNFIGTWTSVTNAIRAKIKESASVKVEETTTEEKSTPEIPTQEASEEVPTQATA
jgi:hypothetical protein